MFKKKKMTGDDDPKHMHNLDDSLIHEIFYHPTTSGGEESSFIQRLTINGRLTCWFQIENYFRKNFDKFVTMAQDKMGLQFTEKHYTSNPFKMCWGTIYCDHFYQVCNDCVNIDKVDSGIFKRFPLIKPKRTILDIPKDNDPKHLWRLDDGKDHVLYYLKQWDHDTQMRFNVTIKKTGDNPFSAKIIMYLRRDFDLAVNFLEQQMNIKFTYKYYTSNPFKRCYGTFSDVNFIWKANNTDNFLYIDYQ